MKIIKDRIFSWLYCPNNKILTILPKKNCTCTDHYVYYAGDPDVKVLLTASYNTICTQRPRLDPQGIDYNIIRSRLKYSGINVNRIGCYIAEQIYLRTRCDLVLFDNAFCPETVTDFVQNNDLSNEKAVIEYSLSGSIHANYGKTNNEFFQSIVTEEIDTVISNNRKCNAELLASKLGCAGVQLSCGYYNANSPSEFTDINLIYSIGGTGVQLVNQIKKYGIFNY